MTWDYTQEAFEKQASVDPIWYLERVITFGSTEKKISKKLLAKHLHELNIPDDRRAFFELLLWDKPF